jgi:hypothetical protein
MITVSHDYLRDIRSELDGGFASQMLQSPGANAEKIGAEREEKRDQVD